MTRIRTIALILVLALLLPCAVACDKASAAEKSSANADASHGNWQEHSGTPIPVQSQFNEDGTPNTSALFFVTAKTTAYAGAERTIVGTIEYTITPRDGVELSDDSVVVVKIDMEQNERTDCFVSIPNTFERRDYKKSSYSSIYGGYFNQGGYYRASYPVNEDGAFAISLSKLVGTSTNDVLSLDTAITFEFYGKTREK